MGAADCREVTLSCPLLRGNFTVHMHYFTHCQLYVVVSLRILHDMAIKFQFKGLELHNVELWSMLGSPARYLFVVLVGNVVSLVAVEPLYVDMLKSNPD